MKIVSVVGARPQFIKASVVSRALRETAGINEVLVHTGQHYDIAMSDVFFDELGLPHADLNLEIGSGSHGVQTGRMLEATERVFLDARPDCVLVYGDTNTTLAAALSAVKLHIPVAHVEAGLRSFDMRMPEEVNRVLTDHASTILFAPTATAVRNLRHEGLGERNLHEVGDVMYDAALAFADIADQRNGLLGTLGLETGGYVLATIHRAENTDDLDRLAAAFDALAEVSRRMPVVLPLHPRTRVRLEAAGRLEALRERLTLIDPVGYLDMTLLTRNAALVATDSGGLQKEAYFHGVRCATLRASTEWTELLELGWNTLLPPAEGRLGERLLNLLDSAAPSASEAAPYGSGDAASRIVQSLIDFSGKSFRPNGTNP